MNAPFPILTSSPPILAGIDSPIPANPVKLAIAASSAMLADDLGEKLEDCAKAWMGEYWVVGVPGRMGLRDGQQDGAGFGRRFAVRFDEPPERLFFWSSILGCHGD
jgi:hypothetical protein